MDAETTEALNTLQRHYGCTLFTALLAAFAVTLARRCRTTDVPIGTDMANRIPRETEELIGMFINQVILRVDLGGDPDFIEILARLRQLTAEAYAHQSVPFEDVIQAVAPCSDRSSPPPLQVKLILENTDNLVRRGRVDGHSDISSDSRVRRTVPAQLDLTLYILDLGGVLRGLLVYDDDVFDAGEADSIIACFTEVLDQMTADPAARVMTRMGVPGAS